MTAMNAPTPYGGAGLDLDFVRSQFPAFSEPLLEGFAHFENAGGSWACGQFIDRLTRYYRENRLQPYYPSAPSTRAGQLMDQARDRLAAWLNVESDEIHFGPSTSQNTYVLAQALRGHLRQGDEIIVTNQDHEANIGAWRRLQEAGLVIREWRVDPETAELDPVGLESLFSDRTRAVAFTHCSNIVGSMHPVHNWVDRVRAAGAIAIVDGVSYCPHGLPDLQSLGADIYLFSLYKVYGPHLGVMFMRRDLNRRLPNQGHFFNAEKAAYRFTPAGPDHAQLAAAGGVVDYLEALDRHHFGNGEAAPAERSARLLELFQSHERSLLPPLLDFIEAHPRTRLIGRRDTADRAPTVAFAVSGQTPEELAGKLAAQGLGVGAGHFYAWRLVEALGLNPETGVLRCSFVHYTRQEEVDRLIQALDAAL